MDSKNGWKTSPRFLEFRKDIHLHHRNGRNRNRNKRAQEINKMIRAENAAKKSEAKAELQGAKGTCW